MKKIITIIVSLILVASGFFVFYLIRPEASAHLELISLTNGQTIQIIKKPNPQKNILIITPINQALTANQLLELGNSGHFQISQLSFKTSDCQQQQQLLQSSLTELGKIDIMAALGETSILPLYWLIQNNDPTLIGLSVGFSATNKDCALPLPREKNKGQWQVIWNDNPDDATSLYTNQQTNTHTLIGNYESSLTELLTLHLNRLLQGNTENLPIIEISPQTNAKDIAIIFYSGDGGWRDLDRDVGQQLANLGYPVIGVDTLRYYWHRKEPSQAAADLAGIMDKYRQTWHIKHFVLTGFSFGADVLPALYNRLTPKEQQQVLAIQLLAFSKGVNYEIKMAGWLTETKTESLTGPEVAKIPKQKLLCIIGEEEAKTSGCTLPSMTGTVITLPGGHHFDKNYPALAKRLIQQFSTNL